jgi:hypothetical protein
MRIFFSIWGCNVFIDLDTYTAQVRIVFDDELDLSLGRCAPDVGVLEGSVEGSVEAAALALPAQLADRTTEARDLVLVDLAGFNSTDEVGIRHAELACAVGEGPVEHVDEGVIIEVIIGKSCFLLNDSPLNCAIDSPAYMLDSDYG